MHFLTLYAIFVTNVSNLMIKMIKIKYSPLIWTQIKIPYFSKLFNTSFFRLNIYFPQTLTLCSLLLILHTLEFKQSNVYRLQCHLTMLCLRGSWCDCIVVEDKLVDCNKEASMQFKWHVQEMMWLKI